jgi:hypothetical protein
MSSFDPNAASQINVDPALKPKTPKEIAVRRQQLIEMFMNQGMDQPTAEREADRYLADFPAFTGQRVAGPAAPAPAAPVSPRDAMEADLYSQGYSDDEARKQADMQAEMRAKRERREFENTMNQRGYGLRRAPGPVPVDGSRVQPGAEFATPEEAEGYYTREQGGTPGGYQQSQYDRDLEQRGLVYRYNEHGELGLSPIASDDRAAMNVPYGVPGAPGRLGQRPGLEAAGWRSQEVETPSGPRRVFVPEQNYQFVNGQYVPMQTEGEAIGRMDQVADGPVTKPRIGAKDRRKDFDAERRLYRMAAKAGMSPEEMRKRHPGVYGDTETGVGSLRPGAGPRQDVEAARAADERARKASFTRTMQSRYNPMEYLGRGDLNQWQQFVAAEQMLGGGAGFDVEIDPRTGARKVSVRRGASPNAVAATQNQQLMDFMTKLGINPALLQNGAANDPLAQMLREKDLPLPQRQKLERDRNGGTLPANSPVGQETLQDIEARRFGLMADPVRAVEMSVDDAVAAGIPRPEAEAYFNRRLPPAKQREQPPVDVPPGAPSSQVPPPGPRPMPPSRPF